MKKAQLDHFLSELQSAKDAFDQAISELGEEIRQQVVIPICKLINREVSRNQYLGYFVYDVRKEDYK